MSACLEERECNRFGIAAASGDINNDGLDDISVGANAESLDESTKLQGRVYVYTSRLCGALRCFNHAATYDSPSPIELSEVLFGSSVAAGDVDGDQKDDVVVGAFRDDVDGRQEQGRVYVFLSGHSPTNHPVFFAWLEDVLWFRGWPLYEVLRDSLPMPWPPLIYSLWDTRRFGVNSVRVLPDFSELGEAVALNIDFASRGMEIRNDTATAPRHPANSLSMRLHIFSKRLIDARLPSRTS